MMQCHINKSPLTQCRDGDGVETTWSQNEDATLTVSLLTEGCLLP